MPISLQEQADSCAALLYLQDLIDAGLIEIKMEINVASTKALQTTLKWRGFEANEKRAVDLDFKLAVQAGGRIL